MSALPWGHVTWATERTLRDKRLDNFYFFSVARVRPDLPMTVNQVPSKQSPGRMCVHIMH